MAAEFPEIDFHSYHEQELPRLLREGRGVLAATAARRLGPFAFRVTGGSGGEGESYTYRVRSGGVEVVAGDAEAETVIEIGCDDWQGLANDLESAPGLLYAGRVKCLRGKAMKLVAWEPSLRAMYTGRPPFDPFDIQLEDQQGAPLDGEQSFAPDDDPADMAHFLRTAGYLLVRDVFRVDEVDVFLREARELRGEAVKGDKLSWWGKNRAGEEILCRVTRAGARPHLSSIPSDPRMLSLVALSDHDLAQRAPADSEENISVIYKNPDMVEGLSDLPWHRDCGMGGHAVMCPVLIASIFLTASNPQTGELKYIPGSWRGTCGYMDPASPRAPEGAHFNARPGDVSLHYGDVMHAAPPPAAGLESYRVSAVTGYVRAGVRHHRGEKNYNEVLHQRDDGQIEHLADVAKRR